MNGQTIREYIDDHELAINLTFGLKPWEIRRLKIGELMRRCMYVDEAQAEARVNRAGVDQ